MKKHPYESLPDYANWRRSISNIASSDVDPVVAGKFTFSKSDKIATAGSCFAQHIATHLKNKGYNYFVTETIHPIASPEIQKASSYGQFSARYGNIYTSRQLVQLFDRAFGNFNPEESVWETTTGRYVDPFRPKVEPKGFTSIAELVADREKHFRAVRRAFEELDVFVFTLGLTEVWMSKSDGAAYPLCPGVAGGKFDPDVYDFVNLTVSEVVADLDLFAKKLGVINPDAKIILTVSPVPLVATALDRHVLTSTTYSKSVLRVAAEEISNKYENIAYFPSFEIITGNHAQGKYFAGDLRTVRQEGVEHVMRLLMLHYTTDTKAPIAVQAEEQLHSNHLEEMEGLVQVNCDEEALDS